MTEKALVEIFVPAAAETFDVYIPLACKIGQILPLAAAALSDLSQGKFLADQDTVLCDRNTGSILDVDMEAAELGIHNGSRLMLI